MNRPIACLCGSTKCVLRYPTPDRECGLPGEFWVVTCVDCGLWYTAPRPARHEMAAWYPPDYAPHQPGAPAPARLGWRRIWWVPRLRPGARVLEIGPGNGRFAQWARTYRQWRVTTTDQVELLGPRPPFDLVVGWQVLEHLWSPPEVLARLWEALRPGGWLCLTTPNVQSLERWVRGAASDSHFGRGPRHLWYFSPGTLRPWLEDAGFHEIRFHGVRDLKGVAWPWWLRVGVGTLLASVNLSAHMLVRARR